MSFLVGNNKGHLASQDSPDKADSNLIEDKIGMHLAVTARSRFPRRWFDYIAEQHKYRPNYLNPEGWVLELNAAPRPEQEALAMAKADRFSQIPGGGVPFRARLWARVS